jgi:outer membrane protein TolC
VNPAAWRWAIVALAAFAAPACAAGELADLLRDSLDHPSVGAAQHAGDARRRELSAETRRYFGSGAMFADASSYEDERFMGVLTPTAFANPPFAQDITRYGAFYQVPLDLAGAIRASRSAAVHDLAAAQLAERQMTLLKMADTTAAYVQMQAQLRQQRVLAVQRERVTQTVERVTLEVETQQSSVADLRLAEAELSRLRSDEIRLSGAVELAQAALEESSGRTLVPGSAVIAIPAWDAPSPGDMLPAALARERESTSAARAQATERALWPALSLTTDYTQFEGGGNTTDAWGVMVRVSMPFDPSGWRRVSAAKAEAKAAGQSARAAERESERAWTSLATAYRSAMADVAALRDEVAAREEVVRVQAELERVGLASLEEFLRQLRDLLDAESRLGAAEAQAVNAWAAAQVLSGAPPERFIERIDGASLPPEAGGGSAR